MYVSRDPGIDDRTSTILLFLRVAPIRNPVIYPDSGQDEHVHPICFAGFDSVLSRLYLILITAHGLLLVSSVIQVINKDHSVAIPISALGWLRHLNSSNVCPITWRPGSIVSEEVCGRYICAVDNALVDCFRGRRD